MRAGTDENTFFPKNRQDWRQWLEENYSSQSEVWLIYRKKGTGDPNLSWEDGVEEALCFGWIDGIRKTVDEKHFKQRYSPRKTRSTWSKKNKETVHRLIQSGQMRESGLLSIEVAKENGTWTALDSIEALEIPKDLNAAFSQNPSAKAFYESLSKSKKKQILAWLSNVKRQSTREKRILEIVENAGAQMLPRPLRN